MQFYETKLINILLDATLVTGPTQALALVKVCIIEVDTNLITHIKYDFEAYPSNAPSTIIFFYSFPLYDG